MSTHNLYFLSTAGILLVVLASASGYYYSVGRRSAQLSWEGLLQQLTWVDRNTIAQVALDLADETAGLEPSQLWSLLGGLKGLEVLETNSEVLIALACYLQRWHPEAIVTAERLRLDARELKWHVSRLKGAAETGNLQISFPFYAQRAAVAYYLMTQRVLDLYAAGQFGLLADLQRAI